MLLSLGEIRKHSIHATDGDLGSVADFLFDDQDWHVRYVVADTRKWLPGRKVLIAPTSLQSVDNQSSRVSVALTMEQIRSSPPLETEAPLSRRMEEQLSRYYAWPVWWNPQASIEAPKVIGSATPGAAADPPPVVPEDSGPILRSFAKVMGYSIEASDGSIGHAKDFIVELPGFLIRYVVVDTGKWLPGRKVLVAIEWVQSVRWDDSSFHVALDRGAIERSPEYVEQAPLTRDYESQLYHHYRRPGYWNM